MPMLTQAAVQRETGAAPVIEEVEIADPRADEVLVEMRGVGICHTDMVMRDGHLPVPVPVVLGHEGSGVVQAVGADVTDLSPGDRVVLSFASCGHCRGCNDNAPAYCDIWVPLNFFGARADGSTALTGRNGETIHSHIFGQSSFARHAVVARRNVIPVDAELPIELLGPLGCGIQTGAGTILNALKVRPGSSVAVIGVGAVGLSAVMAARIAGAATIVALDLNDARIALARELGATHGFRADSAAMTDHAVSAGAAGGFDYIVDTTGIPAVCNAAIPALGLRGELALVGAYPPGQNIVADATLMMSGGRVVRGVVEGSADPSRFIPELIRHWKAGNFPFDRLIRTFPFDRIGEAIAAGEQGDVVKPVVVFS